MDISVIIPLFNEEESLPELFAWIKRVMDSNDFTYEVIFVNDGSTDRSWNVIEELAEKNEQVKGIKFRRNYGKSPALFCGFKEAQGDVVITMDADLQDSPDEIPGLYQMIMKEGYDIERDDCRIVDYDRPDVQTVRSHRSKTDAATLRNDDRTAIR